MKQLVDFNISKAGTKKYWCLRNVRMGYGVAPKYNDAWQAWTLSPQFTTPIPKGVDVPVYFSFVATLDGVRKNWGHIAVQLADGRVWTDGRYYSSVTSLQNNYLSNGKYVGWSTEVNGVKVIEQGDVMDTDAKVKAQYYTLRGNEGTASERKHWIGKSYEEFNSVARAEARSRTQHISNLKKAVDTLTKERDVARTEVARITRELLAEQDRVKKLEAEVSEKDEAIQGAKEAYATLEKQHQAQIKELEKVIEIKDKEIDRLNKELSNCKPEEMTGWEMIIAGIKKLFERSNNG